MGACDFMVSIIGKYTPEAAFRVLREQALYEEGHGGYTGTIAEKDSFRMVTTTPREYKAQLTRDLAAARAHLAELRRQRKANEFSCGKAVAQSIFKHQIADAECRLKALVDAVKRFKVSSGARAIANAMLESDHLWTGKWEPACCIELTGQELKRARARRPDLKGKTKIRAFVFFGLASE